MRTVRININNFKPGDVFVVRQDENQIYVKRPLRNMGADAKRKYRKELRSINQQRASVDKVMELLGLTM